MTLPLYSLFLIPWLAAAVVALLPKARSQFGYALAVVATLLPLVPALAHYGSVSQGGTIVELTRWVPSYSIDLKLTLDGGALLLVVLACVVAPLGLLTSRRLASESRGFCSWFLVLQGAALGVFLTRNFFFWFLFWEFSLIPAYFLVRLWGGTNGAAAAYRFVVYTLSGSAFMLAAFAGLYATFGTFDFDTLQGAGSSALLGASPVTGWLLFLGVLAGLAVKAPLFPFHSWMPATYGEAPTGAAMFLTGVMSKMGVFGFFRILAPIFPAQLAAAAPVLLWLSLGGILVGAFAALRQTRIKGMLAYSSLNHVSYCLLALFASASNPSAAKAAVSGSWIQMFNHGISAAALFAVAGMLGERSEGSDEISSFGGLRTRAPILTGLAGIALFSSLGLPGLGGFIGEFLIFQGAFAAAPLVTALACFGLLATAVFLLTFVQRVFAGPVAPHLSTAPDASRVEILILAPFALLCLIAGLHPQLLGDLLTPLATVVTVSP